MMETIDSAMKAHACPECSYTTNRRNNLRRHIQAMHRAAAGLPLHCCGIYFPDKAALRQHNFVKHRNGYKCDECGRNFCRKALLKRHYTVHTGRKEFKCAKCDYATSHKSNLDRHMKVHNRSTMKISEPRPKTDLKELSSNRPWFKSEILTPKPIYPCILPTYGNRANFWRQFSGPSCRCVICLDARMYTAPCGQYPLQNTMALDFLQFSYMRSADIGPRMQVSVGYHSESFRKYCHQENVERRLQPDNHSEEDEDEIIDVVGD